jgi:hypothetical protein
MNALNVEDLPGAVKRDGLYLNSYCFLFFCAFVLFSFFKLPAPMIEGRFWAEEGTVFFKDLMTRSFVGAIVYEYRGTVQLLTAIPVWVATRAPLWVAPYILTYFGFSIVCIVFFQLYDWAKRTNLTFLSFLLMLVAWMFIPATYEVWASAVNVQWICSLSALLILLMDRERLSSHIRLVSFWIGLCGFTGVPSCMLAPVFITRAIVDRSKPHGLFGLILSLSSIVQLVMILKSGVPDRHFSFHVSDLLVATSVQTIMVPLFGVKPMNHIMISMFDVQGDYAEWRAVFFSLTCFIPIFYLAFGLNTKRFPNTIAGDSNAIYIVTSWLLVSFLNIIGSLGEFSMLLAPGAGRYFFFGASCFCLLLGFATTAKPQIVRAAATISLALIASVGISQRFFGHWPAQFISGPSWQRQIQNCPSDEPCLIGIWPDGWKFVLPPAALK